MPDRRLGLAATRPTRLSQALAALTGAEPRERLDPTGGRRDLRLALACLAGGLLLLALHAYDRNAKAYLVVLPLVVVCAAVLLRRTAPVVSVLVGVAAVLADLAIGPSLGTILVFTQVLYDAALYGRRWLLPWLLRIAAPAVVITTLTLGLLGYGGDAIGFGVTMALVTGLPVVSAWPVRQHRERARVERERAEQVARLAELDRRHAVEAERSRMARELHDVIANHLSAVAIHATAGLSLRHLDADALRELLVVIRDNSVRGLADMRELVSLLREPDNDHDGAVRPRLADVAGLAERAAGVTVRVTETGERTELPVAVDLAAYRIVQESLTNAVKHAAGGVADVHIEYGPAAVTVTVDSWAPGTVAPGVGGAGMGLIGMRERATLLGGRFEAGPHGGPDKGGWRVRAELPTVREPAAVP